MSQQSTPAPASDPHDDRVVRVSHIVDAFTVGVYAQNNFDVVEVCGELDLATSPQLREVLADLLGRGHARLVVDLSQVSFIDSTALGVLVGAHRSTRAQGGSLALASPDRRCLRTMEITGLTSVFDLQPSVAAATGILDVVT